MSTCSECSFFYGDGICMNCKSKRREVGYFQKACGNFNPAWVDGNKPEKAQDESPTVKSLEKYKVKMETKVCKVCGKEKPIEEFARNRYGYTSLCKACKASQLKKAREAKEAAVKDNASEVVYKPIPNPTVKPDLSKISDEELVQELKARGYRGKLTKTTKIEL